MDKPNVVIVIAKCSHNKKCFGILFEEKSQNKWVGDWSFPIEETSAKNEGYDRVEIKGEIFLDSNYPGCPRCPHCNAKSFFNCSCCKVACWNGEDRTVTCPSCGRTMKLQIGGLRRLKAGEDR